MRKIIALIAILGSLSACEGYPGSGAAIGGVVGGTVGAASGASLCGYYNPGCMVAGTIIGGLAGAAVGNSVQRQQQYYYSQQAPQYQYYQGSNPGADAAYRAGQASRDRQIQRQIEYNAYNQGYRGR